MQTLSIRKIETLLISDKKDLKTRKLFRDKEKKKLRYNNHTLLLLLLLLSRFSRVRLCATP